MSGFEYPFFIMPKNRNNSTIAYIKLTTAIAIWGGSFIATKIAVQEVTPVTVVWLRFLIGIIILGYIAWKQKELVLPSWERCARTSMAWVFGHYSTSVASIQWIGHIRCIHNCVVGFYITYLYGSLRLAIP